MLMDPAPPPLIQCHGRCQREKIPALFHRSDISALLKAANGGKKYNPVCRQCRIDRKNKTGPYAEDVPIVRPKPQPHGWAFRTTQSSLCPNSLPGSARFAAAGSFQAQRRDVA